MFRLREGIFFYELLCIFKSLAVFHVDRNWVYTPSHNDQYLRDHTQGQFNIAVHAGSITRVLIKHKQGIIKLARTIRKASASYTEA